MIQPCIIRKIVRPPAEILKELANYGVATVHEAYQKQGLMRPDMKPVVCHGAIAGAAVTSLNHAGDNLMLHAALGVCERGDILVVAVTSPCTDGMVGELIVRACRAREVTGIIVDAGVRDTAALQKIGLPVWSRAISAMGTAKCTPGWVNVPVVCGGVVVKPGDAVVADEDGVVVVGRKHIPEVLEEARSRFAREEANKKRYDAGELSLDINNLREVLQRTGVIYLESIEETNIAKSHGGPKNG